MLLGCLIYVIYMLLLLFLYAIYHIYYYPYCCPSTIAENTYNINDKPPLDEIMNTEKKLHHFKQQYKMNLLNTLCVVIFITITLILGIVWLLLYCFFLIYNRKYLHISSKQTRASDTNCKSVGIIGAGPSGLITAKILQDYGHSVTIFDASSSVGGSFQSSYDGYLTTSNLLTEFSMFPIQLCDLDNKNFNLNTGVILKFSEYVNYLRRFVKTFNLNNYIHFNHKIVNIKKNNNNQWIFYYKTENDKIFEYTKCKFDHFVICTGVAGTPKYPTGLDNFTGTLIHASQYFGNDKNANIIKNKNVLVIGFGESASDISYYICKDALKCVLSSRDGPGSLVARYTSNGYAFDLDTTRSNHGCRDYWKITFFFRFKIFAWMRDPFYPQKRPLIVGNILFNRKYYTNKTCPGFFEKFGCKSYGAIKGMLFHGLQYKPGIKNVLSDHKSIQFMDDTIFENVDTIVCCTGYCPDSYGFLHENIGDSSLFNPRKMYKHQFHMDFGKSFSFVGLNRAQIGSLIAVSELSARYVAQIISNIKELPNKKDMINDINKRYARNKYHFPRYYDTVTTLTDFLATCDELGDVIGCKPDMFRLFVINPYVWYKVMTGPILTCHYRIFGPNSMDIKKIQSKLSKIRYLSFSLHVFQFCAYCMVNIVDYFKKIIKESKVY
eukprot:198652_1